MTLKNPNFKTHLTFKNVMQVLRIISVQGAKLHFTGGVYECIRCGEIPTRAVALPCGDVGCENCLVEFMNQREGDRSVQEDVARTQLFLKTLKLNPALMLKVQ